MTDIMTAVVVLGRDRVGLADRPPTRAERRREGLRSLAIVREIDHGRGAYWTDGKVKRYVYRAFDVAREQYARVDAIHFYGPRAEDWRLVGAVLPGGAGGEA